MRYTVVRHSREGGNPARAEYSRKESNIATFWIPADLHPNTIPFVSRGFRLVDLPRKSIPNETLASGFFDLFFSPPSGQIFIRRQVI